MSRGIYGAHVAVRVRPDVLARVDALIPLFTSPLGVVARIEAMCSGILSSWACARSTKPREDRRGHAEHDHAGQRTGGRSMVDLGDPQDLASWLRALEEACADLERAALDRVRPLGERELGRASAPDHRRERVGARKLIDAARRSAGYGDPAGSGGAGDAN